MNLYATLNTKGMIAELKRRGYIVTQAGTPGMGYQPTEAKRGPAPKPIPSQDKGCCKCHSCKEQHRLGRVPPPHKP